VTGQTFVLYPPTLFFSDKMASMSRQIIKSVVSSNHRILISTSTGGFNIQKRYARKIPEYFERFKVEPRQPIDDLVTHKLLYKGNLHLLSVAS